MTGPKLLQLVFLWAHSGLYRATLNIKMRFGSLPTKQDQSECISSKTHHVVAV